MPQQLKSEIFLHTRASQIAPNSACQPIIRGINLVQRRDWRGGGVLEMHLVLICICLLYLDLECSQVESRGAATHHTCTRMYARAQHAYLWVLKPSLSEPDVINKSNICCDNSIRLSLCGRLIHLLYAMLSFKYSKRFNILH